MSKKIELTMKNGMIEQAVEGWTQEALKSVWGSLSEISIYPDGWNAKSERRALRNRGAKVISHDGSEIVEAHFKEVTFVYKSCIRRDREAAEAAEAMVSKFLSAPATPAEFHEVLMSVYRSEKLLDRVLEAAQAQGYKVVCKFERGEFCIGKPQGEGMTRRTPFEFAVARSFDEIFVA